MAETTVRELVALYGYSPSFSLLQVGLWLMAIEPLGRDGPIVSQIKIWRDQGVVGMDLLLITIHVLKFLAMVVVIIIMIIEIIKAAYKILNIVYKIVRAILLPPAGGRDVIELMIPEIQKMGGTIINDVKNTALDTPINIPLEM